VPIAEADERNPASAPGAFASSEEVVSWLARHIAETNLLSDRTLETRGTAMNTIVATVLKSTAEDAQADVRPFNIVALFCGVGLLASLCLAALGVDVSGSIF
jgi:hypothetical protein